MRMYWAYNLCTQLKLHVRTYSYNCACVYVQSYTYVYTYSNVLYDIENLYEIPVPPAQT